MTPWAMALLLGLAPAAVGQVIQEFRLHDFRGPLGIAAGSDGNLWFTEGFANQIGRITTAGAVMEFPIPTPGTGLGSITPGPDGNLWFIEASVNQIGRITTGGVVSEFSIPTADSGLARITAGPDGSLWFTEAAVNQIGRITTAGVVSEFPVPSNSYGITAGPDGNLWFTENSAARIGRMTTAGAVTEFPVPSGNAPSGITAGPDGNLWFTDTNGNGLDRIGRITTAGAVTEFLLPGAFGLPSGIAAGADGDLWFLEDRFFFSFDQIGRITTAGAITEFPIPAGQCSPSGIPAGPDGNVWFTEGLANQIGRITTGVAPAALAVDPFVNGNTNGNGVLEMFENAVVVPSWNNGGLADADVTGFASNFTGPAGPAYSLYDPNAIYGLIPAGVTHDCWIASGDCYVINIDGARPSVHFDVTLDEAVTAGAPPPGLPGGAIPSQTWILHVGESFTDVSSTDIFYPSIETIFHAGVTAGCGDGTIYCPLQNNLRQEMAVFLLKASQERGYAPPPCNPPGIFTDVLCPGLYTDWVEALLDFGITAGCQLPDDPLAFCPDRDITREEIAVFLLKTLLGSSYDPPNCAGIFSDVPCTPGVGFSDWIEDLYNRGITAGCQVDPDPLAFCPTRPVTRQEMAAFLKTTFGLVLYGP